MSTQKGFQECHGHMLYSFLKEGNVHLRYPQPGGDEKLCPVRSLSVAGGMLVAEWTAEARTQGSPPPIHQNLSIYAMRQGVLHVCSGRVVDTSTDDWQRLRIKIDADIKRVNLRRHQRYMIRGILSLGPQSGDYTYIQDSDHDMDLSLGGFGCRLPRVELDRPIAGADPGVVPGPAAGEPACGPVYSIRLTAYAECCGRANHDLPAVTLVCHAELRRRVRQDNSFRDLAGFQFTDMGEDESETLKLWLTANSLYLRHC